MSNSTTPYPKKAIELITEQISTGQKTPEDQLELVISIKASGLNVRDLSGYLDFIDRVYGRLSTDGLRSYAQRPADQIRVTVIRTGSLEIIFKEVLANLDKVSATVMVGLLLRYLPAAVESLAAAYKDYQDAQLTKLRREKLRREMEKDSVLNTLEPGETDELADYMDSLYEMEYRSLPSARRFAEQYVEAIEIEKAAGE